MIFSSAAEFQTAKGFGAIELGLQTLGKLARFSSGSEVWPCGYPISRFTAPGIPKAPGFLRAPFGFESVRSAYSRLGGAVLGPSTT
ncbi:MAG: hypothetical protein U5N10_12275 [Gemmobacter sp.]|nr:hypothetical protein [Gemmobacter sp.]